MPKMRTNKRERTKQSIVLEALKNLGKPAYVEEVSKVTGLTITQVHSALVDLKRRRLALSEREVTKVSNQSLPLIRIKATYTKKCPQRVNRVIDGN